MIHYLEINEFLTEKELITKHPQSIRLEVANKEDALEKYKNTYKSLFSGKYYTAQIHYHTSKSEGICELELIEEVLLEEKENERTI